MASTWRLRLQGEGIDLQDLAALFPTSPLAHITREEREYYLELPSAPDTVDDRDARALGQTALDQVNAIAALLDRAHRPVTVSGVSRFDPVARTWSTAVYMSFAASVRVGCRFTVEVRDANGDVVPPPRYTSGEAILELVQSNAELERALYLYGRLDHDWRGLYIILEVIEDANGDEAGLIAKGWVSSGSIKKFKSTANSYHALKEQARHGSTKIGILQAKMSLEEARGLIDALLNAWTRDLSAATSP